MNLIKKSISPLISTVLIILIVVVIGIIFLNWSNNFTNKSLSTSSLIQYDESELTGFFENKDVLSSSSLTVINNSTTKDANITSYEIVSLEDYTFLNRKIDFSSTKSFETGKTLQIDIPCMPERQFDLKLYTDQNTIITVPVVSDERYVGTCSDVCWYGDNNATDLTRTKVICSCESFFSDIPENYRKASEVYLDYNTFILGKDLDCSSINDVFMIGNTTTYNNFDGVIDGDNHSLNNFYLNNFNPMFYYNYGTIKNIKFNNVNFTFLEDSSNFNSFLIYKNYGTLERVDLTDFNISSVYNVSFFSPFLIYNNEPGLISKCSFNGDNLFSGTITPSYGSFAVYNKSVISESKVYDSVVSTSSGTGGFLSYQLQDNGDILNSYIIDSNFTGGSNAQRGLLIGSFYSAEDGNIVNSYVSGIINNTNNPFVGFVLSSTGYLVENSFWDVTVLGSGSSGANNYGATGKTATELKTLATYADWNISTTQGDTSAIWYIDDGNDYPHLQWEYQ